MTGEVKRTATIGIGIVCLLTGCRTTEHAPRQAQAPALIRFLLIFDDGPSIREKSNPTLAIAEQLMDNLLQPGIKAIFFVQVGHPRGGGTPRGREIINILHQQGHEIGIHSISTRGHVSHVSYPDQDLLPELERALDEIEELTGSRPRFVHPPFGAYNSRTRTIYQKADLTLLLANIRARDGIIYVFNKSPRRRLNMRRYLQRLKDATPAGEEAIAIVNFHDTNPYTAAKMTEYLFILAEEARRVGFTLPEQPFCGSREEIARVAKVMRLAPPAESPLPAD